MPIGVNKRFDIEIGGNGYMLARPQGGGRAWQRTGVPDVPYRLLLRRYRDPEDAKFGGEDPTLDWPEVYDDFSGGYGYAYRPSDANARNVYHWAANFDARWPHQLVHCQAPRMAASIMSGLSTVNFIEGVEVMFDVPGDPTWGNGPQLIIAGARGVVAASPTATNYFTGGNLALRATNRAATYGSNIYFGDAGGTQFRAYNVSSTALSVVALPGFHFVTAGNRLWRASGSSQDHVTLLQNLADPNAVGSAVDWSATYNIGNYGESIKDIISLDDQVFAGTLTGLYAGDQTGTFVNVLADLGSQQHLDNCRDLAIYNGTVVVPHVAGVFAYDPRRAAVEDISPPRSDRSPVIGRVRSVRGFGRWLYQGLYTGSLSWLLCRDDRGIAHTLQQLPHQAKISRLYIDGITVASDGTSIANHFWAAMDASIDTGGTAPLYVWPIPMLDGNPLAPSPAFSANYVATARIDLGNTDWGAPSTPKVFRSVEVWADKLASGYQYGDIYYDIDHSGSFTLLGRAQGSPKSTLYFSQGEGSFVTGQSIELSLQSFTASSGITPIYRSIILRGGLRPRSIDQITAMVRIADGIRDRQGGEMRSGATMLQELRNFADPTQNGNMPHQLIDLAGATSWAAVLPPVEEQEVFQKGEDYPEVVATIKIAIMNFSGG